MPTARRASPRRGSYLQADIRPREHFLDSFNGVSLAAALEAIRE